MTDLISGRNIVEQDAASIASKVDLRVLNNKTILITGASGLLGIYLLTCIKTLVRDGYNVKTIAVFRSELPSYLVDTEFPGLQIMKGDITDLHFCELIPQADFIIHAAGYGQPLKFMDEPVKTLKLNTFSTFLLFEKLNTDGHFLFVSSSEVYSGLQSAVYTEEQIGHTDTTHPRACYIEGKRGGETICNAYRSQGIKASSVRLAHTYGPGTKKGDKRVILAFIEKALDGQITLMDQGEAVRTYCYVEDAVEIIWRILLSCKEPVYNLGGRSQISIAGVAETIGKIMNVPVVLPSISKSVAGAPPDVQLDMSMVTNEFAKQNYIVFEDGIRKTINWYLSINKT